MLLNQIHKVTALGLTPSEERLIKIMLTFTSRAANYQAKGHYEWTDSLDAADTVIVNASDEAAMSKWQSLSINNSQLNLILITATNDVPYTKYYCARPLAPAKILALLDKVVMDMSMQKAEPAVFSGKGLPMQHEFDPSVSTVIAVRQRALVVDDSPTVRKKMVLELGNFNIRVDTAETGELGLQLLKEHRYEIVFLDVVLPGVDGYQICKSIKRNPETKSTPVIMLSGKSSPFDKVRGSLAGCDSYLAKPVDYDHFYRIIETYLAPEIFSKGVGKKSA